MKRYELTPSQLSIYQMGEYAGEAIDNISSSICFQEEVSIHAIEFAVNEVIKNNDALRIQISKGDEVRQYIKEFKKIKLDVLDFKDISEFDNWAKDYAGTSTGLDGTLYQIKVIKVDLKIYLYVKMHHLIADAWTVARFFSLVTEYTKQYEKNQNELETKNFPSYLSFIEKCQNYKASDRYKRDEEYFKSKLKDCSECVTLTQSNGNSLLSKRISKLLDVDFAKQIKDFCNKNRSSEYCLFMTILGIYIHKISLKKQFYIGTTFLNRDGQADKSTLGMFISSQAFYMSIASETFMDNLMECKKNIFEAMRHQRYTYMDVLSHIESTENTKLYDVTLNYQNAIINNMDEDYNLEWYHCKSQIESLDIHMYEKKDGTLRIIYDYQTDKYQEWEITYHHNHMLELLKEAMLDPYQNINKMNYISVNEINKLHEFNNTYFLYNKDETIITKFEKQVKDTPNNIAVVYENQSLSYEELNKKANQFARKIKDYTVKPDDFIAIIAERSIEMIVGIYGILKSGGAYVPIDPSLPEDRIQYILTDCKPKVIVTYQYSITTDVPVLDLSKSYDGDDSNVELINSSSNLAYCIFTSGTTGKPKGVMIEHRSLINMVTAYKDIYKITSKDITLQFASFSFDQSVWDIFNTTLYGGTLCMMRSGLYSNLEEFKTYVNEKGVTIAALTPAYISECNPEDFPTLRILESGGDQARVDVLKKWSQYKEVFNTYGPTEVTVNAITFKCDKMFNKSTMPIGKPIHNLQIYIVNENNLCGIGIAGELCIAGDGLARGYLNRLELTNEKFTDGTPFTKGRLYHTGDLARWMPDGNIEYLGRIDKQVKIRGFRIELGEIENVIRKNQDVKDACVIAKKDNSNELALYAYIISDYEVDITNIRKNMSKDLPEYMIPAYMMELSSLPLNKNGKLDVKALPDIKTKNEREYVEARDDVEELICATFQDILNVEKVGIKDDFFGLGGHSIKATKIINILENSISIKLLIKEIFQNPTPEKLAEILRKKEKQINYINKAEVKEYYPMSSVQKRLYTINQLDKDGTSYNMPAILQFAEEIDSNRLSSAYSKLVNRYETLRTNFCMKHGEAVQSIEPELYIKADIVRVNESEKEAVIKKFVQPFCLEQAPLMRVKAIVTEESNYIVIDMHHIISDGVSLELYISEFLQLYNGEDLKEVSLHYKDYSEWMNHRDLRSQEQYWLNIYNSGIPILELPLDYTRPKVQSFTGNTIRGSITRNIKNRIQKIAIQTGLTEYMILLSGVMILLSKYSRQYDIMVGTPVSGRCHKNIENMVGMFVNTVVLRGQPDKDKTIVDFLEEIREICLKAYENQEYPFEELVDKINLPRDMSRNPMFDVMFALEDELLELHGVKVSEVDNSLGTSKFDLTITVKKNRDSYITEFEYCTELFKKETVEAMVSHFEQILIEITKDIKKQIRNINVITEQENNLIKNVFNQTYKPYDLKKSVIEVFKEQVIKTPDSIAVVYKDERLTYKELNSRANVIGHKLRNLLVKRNDFVAIIAEKSIEMIIGIVGIMKAGGAYVPISTSYPKERVGFILNDCRAKVLITYHVDCRFLDIFKNTSVISMEEMEYDCLEELEVVNKPDDVIYSIYTSGTTGKPKGVMIEQQNLLNLIYSYTDIYRMSQKDVVLQFANISFDQSVLELFIALLNGSTLCVIPETYIEDIQIFEEYIISNKVSWLGLTPAYLKELNPDKLTCVRLLESGGAAAEIDILNHWRNRATVFNTYGPTETTVNATSYRFDTYDEKMKRMPIGTPMYNTQIYILDCNQLCGIGIPGELCIAGKGVASGYINREELNREKFTKNPFGEGKLYRSGDLARWLPDGNIEFLGRMDEQVKIRGFRIELGEIENVIRNLKMVQDVAVIVADIGGTGDAICAYVVSPEKIEIDTIRKNIEEELPSYMIPSYFMQIEKLPVNSNGKIDTKALPPITIDCIDNYKAPSTIEEEALAKVFQEVLNIKNISMNDNFFELGGDSIKAIRAVSKLRELGYETSLKNIMRDRTVETIAVNMIREEAAETEQKQLSGEIPMLPIQLEFFDNHFKEEHHYNQAMLLKAKDRLHADYITKAMNVIMHKHDMLRAVFLNHKQIILDSHNTMFQLEHIDLRQYDNPWIEMESKNRLLQKEFNLEKGPLVKGCLYHIKDGDYLFLCIHHLVVDGVSWRIILEDIETVYKLCMENREITLPKKTSSYEEWAKTLRNCAKEDKIKGEFLYWKGICEEALECELCIHPDGKVRAGQAKSESECIKKVSVIQIEEALTKALLYDANRAFTTMINDLLLTSLGMAVKEWTKQSKVCVELESHGREELHRKVVLDRTVGWFTNTYPIILHSEGTIENQIIGTKEMFRKVNANGIGYGVLSYFGESKLPKVKPEICFNYLGVNDIDKSNGIFKLVEYTNQNDISDKNHLENSLTINAIVVDSIMNMEITYDSRKYPEEEIGKFCDAYKSALEKVVTYCVKQDESVKTLSDFGILDIDDLEVNAFIDFLEVL